MAWDTFEAALRLARQLRQPTLLLSGGEPTLHPDCIEFVDRALVDWHVIVLVSNGAFLADKKKTKQFLKRMDNKRLIVQVTYDPRYYRVPLPKSPYSDHFPVDTVSLITPCRRTRRNNILATKGSPSCFNIRALAKQAPFGMNPFEFAIGSLAQLGRFCTPSVNSDGTLSCGEFDTCAKVGHVTDSVRDISDNILRTYCCKCGLWDNLDLQRQRFLAQ